MNEVNSQLRDIMGDRLMENSNIDARYLTKQGLHLNRGGIDLLIQNFVLFTRSLHFL